MSHGRFFQDSLDIEKYFAGEKLYGDDLSPTESREWFEEEKEAYFQLEPRSANEYVYGYHALNFYHGFRLLPDRSFTHVLGFGSALGEELRSIVKNAARITIVEPANGFAISEIDAAPVESVYPQPDGRLPFQDKSFDLITCFSVLHHVPRVTDIVREFYRCTMPAGYVLLKEPIISMGDWRRARKGLTRRERGIPLRILQGIISSAGFHILRERQCMFSLTSRLRYLMKTPVYNSKVAVVLDSWFCSLPFWSTKYHPTHAYHKLRPTAAFFILQKPAL